MLGLPVASCQRALSALVFTLATLGVGARAAQAADPCGRTRFVTVYDSHGLTPFGDRLDGMLASYPGAELTSYTLGGASPSWFLRGRVSPRGYVFNSCEGKPLLPRSKLRQQDVRTPVLEELLRVPEGTYERQVVILTLGSNVPGESGGADGARRAGRARHQRPARGGVHLDRPAGHPELERRLLRRGLPGHPRRDPRRGAAKPVTMGGPSPPRRGPACHLIDSRPFSTYPAGGDGTHYGFNAAGVAAAYRWADGVGRGIDRILGIKP